MTINPLHSVSDGIIRNITPTQHLVRSTLMPRSPTIQFPTTRQPRSWSPYILVDYICMAKSLLFARKPQPHTHIHSLCQENWVIIWETAHHAEWLAGAHSGDTFACIIKSKYSYYHWAKVIGRNLLLVGIRIAI